MARLIWLCASLVVALVLFGCGGGGSGGEGGGTVGGGGGGGGAPAASFSATPLSVQVGTPVQFTDTSTGSPTGWEWDFNSDGTPEISRKIRVTPMPRPAPMT